MFTGGYKITFYSFRNEDTITHMHHRKKPVKQLSSHRPNLTAPNTPPVACFDISRDSQLAAVAVSRSLQIWQLNTPELSSTLDGHTAAITTVSFSPNCEFVATGSEDKTVNIWGLTLGLIVTTFKVFYFEIRKE